jgi:hypothetical protein
MPSLDGELVFAPSLEYILRMGTLLSALDVIVLLLLVAVVLRTVWNELPRGTGSLVLSVCLALVLAVFAIVSISSYMGLVQVSSLLTRGLFLLVLLAMAAMLRASWAHKQTA